MPLPKGPAMPPPLHPRVLQQEARALPRPRSTAWPCPPHPACGCPWPFRSPHRQGRRRNTPHVGRHRPIPDEDAQLPSSQLSRGAEDPGKGRGAEEALGRHRRGDEAEFPPAARRIRAPDCPQVLGASSAHGSPDADPPRAWAAAASVAAAAPGGICCHPQVSPALSALAPMAHLTWHPWRTSLGCWAH